MFICQYLECSPSLECSWDIPFPQWSENDNTEIQKYSTFPHMVHWLNLSRFKVFSFTFQSWSIVVLQCCASFCCRAKWLSYTHTHTHTHTYIFFFFFLNFTILYWFCHIVFLKFRFLTFLSPHTFFFFFFASQWVSSPFSISKKHRLFSAFCQTFSALQSRELVIFCSSTSFYENLFYFKI